MKPTQRISLLFKSLLHDLFGEDGEPASGEQSAPESSSARLSGLLDEAQRQLDGLRLELANAVSHQKRIELARQEAARRAREQPDAGALQEHARGLDELARECEARISELRAAINEQQTRLDGLRLRHLALSDREKSVAALNELFAAQQGLAQRSNGLQGEFSAWEEQIAQREDRLAARREWSK